MKPTGLFSPLRTAPWGALLILLSVILFSLIPLLPLEGGILVEAGLVLCFVTGLIKKHIPLVHLSLLLSLTGAMLGIRVLGGYWPLPLLLALGGYLLVVWRVRRLRETLGWLRWGRLGKGEVLLAFAFIVVSGLALWLWFVFLGTDLSDLRARIPSWPAPALVLLGLGFAVANAVGEEFIFRGAIMQALDEAFGPGMISLVLQAACFGMFHLHGFPRGWVGVGLAFVYGLMTGVIRRRARGMLAPWLTHVFADLVIFTLVVLAL